MSDENGTYSGSDAEAMNNCLGELSARLVDNDLTLDNFAPRVKDGTTWSKESLMDLKDTLMNLVDEIDLYLGHDA